MGKQFILLVAFMACICSRLGSQSVAWTDSIRYGNQNISRGVTSDNSGYVYMSGAYTGGSFTHKHDQNGNLVWRDTIRLGATPGGVVCDAVGNVYTVVWAPSSYIRIGGVNYPGGSNSYVVKYNAMGQIQWVVNHTLVAYDIAIDNYGYIYISGIYSTSSGFTAKYDSNGNFIWEWSVNGYIAFDKFNNMYLTNTNVTKFTPSGAQYWSYPVGGSVKTVIDSIGNCYISDGGYYATSQLVKLTPNGQLSWSINLNYAGGRAIDIDPSGNVIVAGLWGSGNTAYGVEIHKYSPSGIDLWGYQLNNSSSYRPTEVAVKGNDFYISYDDDQLFYTFLTKISTPFTTSLKETEGQSSGLIIHPNPSSTIFNISYQGTNRGHLTITVCDATGKCVKTIVHNDFTGELYEAIDLSGYAKGVYFMELVSAEGKETKKLVLE